MKLKEVVGEVKKLSEDFEALKKFVVEELAKSKLEPIAKHTETVKSSVETEVKEERLEYPIPQEYKEATSNILNKDFKIFLDYKDGNTDFNLIVPEKYSNLTPEQRKVSGGFDRRRRIIPPYEGLNGVKEYLNLVWKSFNPTVQSMIVADRNK